MSHKDADVLQILQQMGLRQEKELTPQEEDMLQRALDPEKQYLYDIERLFTKPDKS